MGRQNTSKKERQKASRPATGQASSYATAGLVAVAAVLGSFAGYRLLLHAGAAPAELASSDFLLLAPLDASRLTLLPGTGWQHTPFARRSPSALRGNPNVNTLSSLQGDCPLSTPRAFHEWTPHYAPSGLAAIKNGYVALDGLVLTLSDDGMEDVGRGVGGAQRGHFYSWPGDGLVEMLLASRLAEKVTSSVGSFKPQLRVLGGLKSLRLASAVRVTRALGIETGQDAVTKGAVFWEWCASVISPSARLSPPRSA